MTSAIPSLPQGWEEQKAGNGRIYYINHAEKHTTWVNPTSGVPSPIPSYGTRCLPEDNLGPLPEGWEKRLSTDGRIYFINHNTRATGPRRSRCASLVQSMCLYHVRDGTPHDHREKCFSTINSESQFRWLPEIANSFSFSAT